MIFIYAAAAISADHEDGIDNPKAQQAVTESPLVGKRDTVMKEELDAIGQYQVFGDSSATCKSVRKTHANLQVTPIVLAGAPM